MTARKRVVEEACWLCQLARDDRTTHGIYLEDYGEENAVNLAWDAVHQAMQDGRNGYGRALWAEAECLLRCGWLPGEAQR